MVDISFRSFYFRFLQHRAQIHPPCHKLDRELYFLKISILKILYEFYGKMQKKSSGYESMSTALKKKSD